MGQQSGSDNDGWHCWGNTNGEGGWPRQILVGQGTKVEATKVKVEGEGQEQEQCEHLGKGNHGESKSNYGVGKG